MSLSKGVMELKVAFSKARTHFSGEEVSTSGHVVSSGLWTADVFLPFAHLAPGSMASLFNKSELRPFLALCYKIGFRLDTRATRNSEGLALNNLVR